MTAEGITLGEIYRRLRESSVTAPLRISRLTLPEPPAKLNGFYQLHSLDRAISVLEMLHESNGHSASLRYANA